ncbi:IS630 family transposase [Corallococcus sicarius]|uniref:IS630 family transposase n=1 Tax=Corallococcus sicarius TaxID=2316726 RepID=UPI001FC92CB2|nr:IS630 family transposase [Corallococcus sicarius]
MDVRRLVFLDESFCNTSMAREDGWAPVGQRARGLRPGGRWTTLTLVGAIRVGCRPKLMTHPRAINGCLFVRFVRQRLCPWLHPGDVVLMDNLGAHKVKGMRQAIEAVGACVVYLPTYSPDFNPIELWWADLKRQLRKRAPRALNELAQTVRQLRAATPLAKLAAWFRHCLAFLQLN